MIDNPKCLGIIIVSVSIFLTGCLEHTYMIRVFPDESVDLEYKVSGDRLDFDDHGQLLPDSSVWDVDSRIEYNEDETKHIYEYTVHLPYYATINDMLFWERNSADSVHLRRSLLIEKNTGILGNEWIFGGVIFSRKFNELYGDIWDFVPEECRALEDDSKLNELTSDEVEKLESQFALGILQWNHQRYIRRFSRMWRLVKRKISTIEDKSFATYSIAQTAWAEDLHQYMNNMDVDDPSLIDLEWWDDLRPLFLGHFTDLVGIDSLDYIKQLSESLEEEYRISKDLEDDLFEFRTKLPGIKIKTDGKRDEDGWITWKFSGKDLLTNEGMMFARSYEVNIMRILIGTFIIALALGLARRFKRDRDD